MTARDEIKTSLYVDHYVGDRADELLDSYANEVVQQAAVMLHVAWLNNFFAVHEQDGAGEAAEFVRAMSVKDGVFQVEDYRTQPYKPWSGDGS